MIERRKHPRFQLPLSLSVERNDDSSMVEETNLKDISISGAQFVLRQNVRVGDEVELAINDIESSFARSLGLDTSDSGPLRFRMHGKVLRKQMEMSDTRASSIAVAFTTPLRIIPLTGKTS